MQEIIDSISSREKAIVFWVIIVLIYSIINSRVRESLIRFLVILLEPKVITIFMLSLIYISIQLLPLINSNVLYPEIIKDLFLWTIFAAFVNVTRISSIRREKGFFDKVLKECVQVTVLIGFIANFYTFHFIIELFLVPLMVIIIGTSAYAEYKKEKPLVSYVLNLLLFLIFLIIGVYVIYKISIEGLGIFFAKESIASFLLPIYLTLTFIPFLYALGLFFVYEELFTRITLIHKKKQKLVKKLKWEIIKKYQFKLKPLVTFSKKLGRDLLELKETEDISELF